jgi:hypothetical protein
LIEKGEDYSLQEQVPRIGRLKENSSNSIV